MDSNTIEQTYGKQRGDVGEDGKVKKQDLTLIFLEVNMRLVMAISALLALWFPIIVIAETKHAGQAGIAIESLPKDLEIQLALSSLPAHLRDAATVYVLNPSKGFEVVRKGSNGFHAFVARTDQGAFRGTWPYTAHRGDILVPIAFDEAGEKSHMAVFFDVAEMQTAGTAPGELKRIVNDRFKTGHYKAPERAGVSYMLSPVLRAYVNPDKDDQVMTFNYPHYMFYAPHVSNEDIGGQFASSHTFIINQGPHGYMIKGVGLTERAVINKEYEEMIARLCEFKKAFCLPTPNNP